MSADDVAAEAPAATATRRDLAVSRALDPARSRAEHRVQLFLDAARELMKRNGGEFTVQEVVERSGQSLRTFYQYFPGKHELLLALFEESIRSAAEHLQEMTAQGESPFDRLRRFTIEYYRMCRVTPKRGSPTGPTPAMVEFAQRLLTSHPQEAAQAFAPLVTMLERLLADASEAGAIRGSLDHRRIAGVVLQAVMFNAFAATISGASSRLDRDTDRETVADTDADLLWDLLLRGIRADG